MTTLLNFPMVSQLTTTTGDGLPSNNAQYDCVAACVDAVCRYLLEQPENSVFNPDTFKDEAYGEAYANKGTAAIAYVPFCASLGVHLYPVNGNPAQLVQQIHQFLAENKPVIFTEPDPYVSNTLGWTHVCVFYQDGPGFLTAMDPYIARPVHRTDQEWIQLLQNNEIWIAERSESMIPQGWHDDGSTLYSPSHMQGGPEIHITGPFREYVLANAWRPSDRFIEPGHHVDVMQYNNVSLGSGFIQTSLWSMLLMPDKGPQAGKVIYAWLGVEEAFLRNAYEAQLTEIFQLKQELTKPGIDVATAAKVADRLTALGLLGKQVESLASQQLL